MSDHSPHSGSWKDDKILNKYFNIAMIESGHSENDTFASKKDLKCNRAFYLKKIKAERGLLIQSTYVDRSPILYTFQSSFHNKVGKVERRRCGKKGEKIRYDTKALLNGRMNQEKQVKQSSIFCIYPYLEKIFVHNFTLMESSFMYPGCARLPGPAAHTFTFSNWTGWLFFTLILSAPPTTTLNLDPY